MRRRKPMNEQFEFVDMFGDLTDRLSNKGVCIEDIKSIYSSIKFYMHNKKYKNVVNSTIVTKLKHSGCIDNLLSDALNDVYYICPSLA